MCGVGSAPNGVYGPDGKSTQSHPNEDGHLRFRGEDGCFLYGVFNGYDGSRVASYVSQFLTAELLLGQLNSTHTDNDAFSGVEKSFFKTIDDALAVKADLSNYLPPHNEGAGYHQLSPQAQKPIIAEPEIHRNPLDGEMVAMVAAELAQQSDLEAAAQAVVERVRRLHHDAYASGRQRSARATRHEDMTLLVRTLDYPPPVDGLLTPTQGRTRPSDLNHSTSKTSVTLSLVMPSQGTLTNGTNTASTVEEGTPTPGSQSGLLVCSGYRLVRKKGSKFKDCSAVTGAGSRACSPQSCRSVAECAALLRWRPRA
ncbi:hypothetical protein CRUP_004937 [Coryphaenoides rupestris]|nr:hypothetical protein CRUP_004937 [Coryphaenoides rupestris]